MLNKINLDDRVKSFFIDEVYLSKNKIFKPLLTRRISFKRQDWKNKAVFISCIIPYSIYDFAYNVYNWFRLKLDKNYYNRKIQKLSLLRSIKWERAALSICIYMFVISTAGIIIELRFLKQKKIWLKRKIELEKQLSKITKISNCFITLFVGLISFSSIFLYLDNCVKIRRSLIVYPIDHRRRVLAASAINRLNQQNLRRPVRAF